MCIRDRVAKEDGFAGFRRERSGERGLELIPHEALMGLLKRMNDAAVEWHGVETS